MIPVPDNSVHPLTRADWRRWLEQHHRRTAGVWLVSYKKATGKPIVADNDAVEEALCFGWIDSKPKKLDAERSMLWFAPRQPGLGNLFFRFRRFSACDNPPKNEFCLTI